MNKREAAQMARRRMESRIRKDPRLLYVYSPTGNTKNERWVFQDVTCLSVHEAFEYVTKNESDG